jgi:hypothetical protein
MQYGNCAVALDEEGNIFACHNAYLGDSATWEYVRTPDEQEEELARKARKAADAPPRG